MKFSLGIKPFTDYWLNCEFNMIFSILTSFESSYKLAAFINDYSYEICELETPTKTKFNCINLKPMIKFREQHINNLFSVSHPINFKYDENYMDFLKDLIRKKEFIMIGVDLFHWIPDSICWNRHHWVHYSLINGFDEEKKVFYVLDENNSGYNEFEIPEERVWLAVQNSSLEPHGYIKRLTNEIDSFNISIDDMIYNAKRLRVELKTIKDLTFWELSNADFEEGHMCDLISMHIFQIINRHKANGILFKYVQNCIQNDQDFNSLMQYSQTLQEGWVLIKNIFVRTYYTDDKETNIIDINQRCKSLINKEYEMWNTFLQSIERKSIAFRSRNLTIASEI